MTQKLGTNFKLYYKVKHVIQMQFELDTEKIHIHTQLEKKLQILYLCFIVSVFLQKCIVLKNVFTVF